MQEKTKQHEREAGEMSNNEMIEKQPFAEKCSNQQMTVGNVTCTPYQQKPFDIWLKEQAFKHGSQ